MMDIGKYIGELLYQHDAVALPGLGTFVSAYQPAEIDQVRGELHPPGKGAGFNPNLVQDDGLLVKFLQNRHHVSFEAAQRQVKQYVEEVQAALERQEMVDFPELGRLYQDYEKNLQFLPDGTNFSLEAYGLPMVEAYPARRARTSQATSTTAPASTASTQPTNYALIGAIAVGVAVILVAGYFLLFNEVPQDEEALLPVPTSRVNVSPSDQKANTDSTVESNEGTASEQESETAVSGEQEREPAGDEEAGWDNEEPTPAPGQKRLVIIIGAFGSQENVSRLVDDIYDAGYEPYTEKSGSLTRVGVQKAYRQPAELERVLNDVRNRFNSDAQLIKK